MKIINILSLLALAAGIAHAAAAPPPLEVVDVVKLRDLEERQHPGTRKLLGLSLNNSDFV
jgi:hypothetical protein